MPGKESGRQKAKIVLIFPAPLEDKGGSLEVPLAILAVAAPLHDDGYEMILIDERLHDSPEQAVLEAAEGALCVGISTITGYQLKRTIHFSKMLKERYPGMPVIWGGYHPSLLPEQCAAEPYVDAVVKGQGERTFQELVARMEAGEGFEGVAGTVHRDAAGEVVVNPERPMDDINKFPRAPYELLDMERFFRMNGGRRSLQYISSQGCPFKCTFCVEPKVFGKWSGRSPEKIVEELAELDRRYDLQHVSFADANFMYDRKRAESMCSQLIERGIKITWSGTARADQVVKLSPELLRLMRQSGCKQIAIGIESGSQAILDLIQKRISREKAIESNRILEEAGIQGVYAFMVGFPKELVESEDEIWQTLMLIKAMRKAHPAVMTITFFVTPYPGTPIFDIAVRLNLKMPKKTEDWADWESTSVSTNWISEEERDLVERCNNFYFLFGYPNTRLRRHMHMLKWMPFLYPLRALAALRCMLNFYGLPVEWRMMKWMLRSGKFRRAGSQIDALRGF